MKEVAPTPSWKEHESGLLSDGARLASLRSRIAMEALRWRELLRKSLLGGWLRVFVAAWRLGGGGLALEVQRRFGFRLLCFCTAR
ncbi:hypothetical protein LR48_Vigan03g272700 [Vigna angularis]|uniref:Uncharacterized protein n=1 Tax=Phaseolus angularis TaxID=3914 RepID=A0A0L9U901_PHAAN|nr:hypothetical protein LR48_Vigan03g272700 [Vigna angularis]